MKYLSLVLISFMVCVSAYAVDIDLDRIIQIESSGRADAYNKNSKARGLCQITPICLTEWNNYNPKEKHTQEQLFNPEINKKIATWYLGKRIPQMLKYFGLVDSVEHRLIAYNWGIGSLRRYLKGIDKLPKETQAYLKKYKRLGAYGKTDKSSITGRR